MFFASAIFTTVEFICVHPDVAPQCVVAFVWLHCGVRVHIAHRLRLCEPRPDPTQKELRGVGEAFRPRTRRWVLRSRKSICGVV